MQYQNIHELAADLPNVQIMEVCGTHTVSIFRTGLRSALPENLRLVSGPGCPVCVTSQGYIDAALEIARRKDVIICTYGDMMRVPGRSGSLESCRGEGADVRIVYSCRDALKIAEENGSKTIVWIGVGFETTAPTTAAAVQEAKKRSITNLRVLSGHKLAIPAMLALLEDAEMPIDGFLCPGHVSVIVGSEAYRPIIDQFGKPCAISGFEAKGMADGLEALLQQLKDGTPRVDNCYGVAVTPEGNPVALRYLETVFDVETTDWRAMGPIPGSGLVFNQEYRSFDALELFDDIEIGPDYDPPGCRCGEVIQGKTMPKECDLFGDSCTPTHPIGPCMVSSEGTCAAWYKYGRQHGA